MLINWCGSLRKAKASTWRVTTTFWGVEGGGGGESKFSVEKHLDSLCLTKGGFLFMVWCQGGFDSWEFKEKGQNFHRMVLHV